MAVTNDNRALTIINRLFEARKIQRVLLVSPPDVDASLFDFVASRRGRYSSFPPYGLGLIASHLRADGVEVEILNLQDAVLRASQAAPSVEAFDFDATWTNALSQTLEDFQPDLVGVTCMFTLTHRSFAGACKKVRELAPNVPIAIGGVHATNALTSPLTARQMFDDLQAVDLFFLYEGELAFRDFVRIINKEAPIENLGQLILRDGNEMVRVAERSFPEGDDLDVIPAYDLIKPGSLSLSGKLGNFAFLKEPQDTFATILLNRGCRARCTFCSVRNFNGAGVRSRSVESVIEELLILRNEHGVDHVMWLDDDFLYDKKRSLQLFNEMVRRNVGITWDCTNGVLAASCSDEMIAAAASSGCVGLSIGMESGNPEILRKIRKPATVEVLEEAAEVLRRYPSIFSRVFVIVGFPKETFRQITDTVNLGVRMACDWYQIQVLQPLPNTPIFDAMVAEGMISVEQFRDVRYYGGAYGKAAKKSSGGMDMLARDFKNALSVPNLDSVPDPDQFDDIWSYMVFHLNYRKIFQENRPEKFEQLTRYLRYICDVVAPNDAYAMYFLSLIERRRGRRPDPERLRHLEALLARAPYWADRFRDFGLDTTVLQDACLTSAETYTALDSHTV